MPFPHITHPDRMTSYIFDIKAEELIQETRPKVLIKGLMCKPAAEDARLQRLLPDAPPGYRWEGHTEYSEDLLRFSFKALVVYRLVEEGT